MIKLSRVNCRGVVGKLLFSVRICRTSRAVLDPILHALETAPEDDEPFTEEDWKAIAEGEEDIRQGRVTIWEDVKKGLGLKRCFEIRYERAG